MPTTHLKVVADTDKFIKERISIPNASVDFHLQHAVDDIIHLFTRPPKMNIPNVVYVDVAKNTI